MRIPKLKDVLINSIPLWAVSLIMSYAGVDIRSWVWWFVFLLTGALTVIIRALIELKAEGKI